MKILACPTEDQQAIQTWAAKWNIPFTAEDYHMVYTMVTKQGLTVNEWLAQQETTQVDLSKKG